MATATHGVESLAPENEVVAAPAATVRLSVALGVVSALAAAATAFIPGVLSGTAVMNGSARGTALVVLFVAVPALAWAMLFAHRGSIRALAIWVGAVGYITYNAVMFAFATPFNRLFPLYVAMLSLSIFVLIGLAVHATKVGHLGNARAPRWVAAYVWIVVVLNGLAWLRVVLFAVFADQPTSYLDGTGLTTNPVFVQDLAFWLPVMAWLAYGLARNLRDRLVLAGGGLVFWVIEGLGVAVDQWAGHRADPASTVATAAGAWLFLAMAAIGLAPAWAVLRRLPGRPVGPSERSRP